MDGGVTYEVIHYKYGFNWASTRFDCGLLNWNASMYYGAAYVNLINSEYKLWSTIFLRSSLSLSSSGNFSGFMEFECSLLYSEKFSIGVYPAPHKSCEHLHTCFFKIFFYSVMPPKIIWTTKWFLTTDILIKFMYVFTTATMEDASSMYSILLFLSSCLTKCTHYKFPQYEVFSS